MPRKEGLGFSVDERTEVPTYEEISSVMERKKKLKKPLKYFLLLIVIIALVGGIGSTIYIYKDYIQTGAGRMSSSFTGLAIGGSISGFMTNSIDYSDKNKFGYEVAELEINLTNEEQELKSNLTSSLTQSLSSTCEQQKAQLGTDIRTQEQARCTTEKNALQIQINSCEEDLEDCESKECEE
jgi:hypothetical protein